MKASNLILLVFCLLLSQGVVAQSADLSVVKTADLTRANVGQNLIYTLTAHNAGPDNNGNVVVTDILPTDVSIVSMDPTCVVDIVFNREIDCQFSLDANTSKVLTIEVKVNSLPPSGPRLYMTGTDTNNLQGFYRYFTDLSFVDVLGASMGINLSPRGVFLQDDGGLLMADSGNLQTVVNGVPIIDGKIEYMHPLEVLGIIIASGGLLVNPDDMVLAPDGMIYVADNNGIRLDGFGQPTANRNGRIIKIDPATGVQSIVSEGGLIIAPTGLIWHNNELVVIDQVAALLSIDPISGIQTPIAIAGLMQLPESVTFANGLFYVADPTVGIISIEPITGTQTIVSAISGGFLLNPIDLDYFNDELFVLERDSPTVWRIDINTGLPIEDYQLNSDMSEINGIDVDTGESYLINHSNILSNSSVIDNNFLNDASNIATPVDPAVIIQILVNEIIQVSDQVIVEPNVFILVSENIIVTDQVIITPSINLLVTENILVTDQVLVSPSLMLLVTETISVTDNVLVVPPIAILITENITVTDQVVVSPALMLLVTETISVTDNVFVVPPVVILVTENISVNDNILTVPSISIVVLENINVLDSVATILVVPPVIVKIKPVSGRCHVQLASGDILPAAVTELEVTFSASMLNPNGDTDMLDVSNPENYRLVSTTDINEILPSNCSDAIGANSIDHNISMRLYDTASKTVVVGSPYSVGLPDERYVFLACYDGLKSIQGALLDGNADGSSGDDYLIKFSINSVNLLRNPNFGDGINSWIPFGGVIAVSDDADNALFAGSANIDLGASISQCVELNGASDMRFGTSLQSDMANGDSTIVVEYFDTAQCGGVMLSSKQSQKSVIGNSWKDVLIDSTVPSNAVSANIIVEGSASQSVILVDRNYFINTSNVIYKGGFEEPGAGNNSCIQSNNSGG